MIHRALMMRFVHRYGWLPRIDTYRTLGLAPTREAMAVLNESRSLTIVC